jgi:N2227-like protein
MAVTWLTPDLLLACLFPLALLALGYSLFPSTTLSDVHDLLSLKSPANKTGPFSLELALKSYASYPSLARNELTRMRKSYSTLSRAHKRIGYNLGYPRKLDRLQGATDVNSIVTNAIADLAKAEFDLENSTSGSDANMGRVRESLKHFVRDWSEEGREERDRMFEPILDVFRKIDVEERSGHKVLVPGCGLGRLAWEISELGNICTVHICDFF